MANARELAVLVLAAGKGTRMKSSRAKVLHEIAGRPLLGYALEAAKSLGAERLLVVVGRDADLVQQAFADEARFVVQAEQKGTGHAVLVARSALEGFRGDVLILYGDTPLLRTETLRAMQARRTETGADLVMLTTRLPLPGIVVRGADRRVARVVEKPDATPAELAIREFNTGVYLASQDFLWKALDQVDDRNAQGEIYLTEIVRIGVAEGRRIEALLVEDDDESLGVNTRADLARAAAVIRRRKNDALMAAGVTLVDPAATYVDVDVEIGPDTVIEPGCTISGPTRIGTGVHVKAHSVIESSVLGDGVVIGPMAHLRPGSELGRGARIGNFVEVKNSRLGAGTKADHLSYIGDADVGAGASFGCGTITVNYDGVAKHRTTVEDGAFVGCNSNLIAPVRIGKDAYVAAGSTVTQDVPAEALAVARERQRNIDGWRRRGGKKKATDSH
ncbi:MAG TPA: bifunctional UDP-N-acetylglucosamine diphosphorylase/glucosamine-1-phosphate N-acetyltransferase GlmU [Myxococcota bacterium]|jgi:bifunctional UDP-N-acetylglucosamine pyrophosphorylase/glucosamine-1-phosphate N-acetyltransferase|nr:bifunctional UDP-N-acetylglucosamine diphosphorylase/glucosamine-1-phosphate N-acetyltransferase GlmU [Myxococcota bacterium]